VEDEIEGTAFRVGGMAKGAGMIAPNLATMLALVTTDAAADPETLQSLVADAAARTFNRVLVDGDSSTNDTVLVLASGRSGMPTLRPGSKGCARLRGALEAVMLRLAQELVRDGEGATKFVEIAVTGARTEKEAQKVADTIARSPLVKTALYGRDPNWGRILCAAGYAGVPLVPEKVRLWIGDVVLLEGGVPTGNDAAGVMEAAEILIRVDLGAGGQACSVWTCDFSHEYVTINAEYHT
jgi:glutamate N-acetyltransferase/amino-acid N-acetyltransferase